MARMETERRLIPRFKPAPWHGTPTPEARRRRSVTAGGRVLPRKQGGRACQRSKPMQPAFDVGGQLTLSHRSSNWPIISSRGKESLGAQAVETLRRWCALATASQPLRARWLARWLSLGPESKPEPRRPSQGGRCGELWRCCGGGFHRPKRSTLAQIALTHRSTCRVHSSPMYSCEGPAAQAPPSRLPNDYYK